MFLFFILIVNHMSSSETESSAWTKIWSFAKEVPTGDPSEVPETRTINYAIYKTALLTGTIWGIYKFQYGDVDNEGLVKLVGTILLFDYGFERAAYHIWNTYLKGSDSSSVKDTPANKATYEHEDDL